MKEAAGEANLTVVAIILIAVVVAVATPLINSLMSTAAYRSCCTDAGAVWHNSACYVPKGTPSSKQVAYNTAYNNCQRTNKLKTIGIKTRW